MKRPSFQFYPGDWLSSAKVALMTPEEEGAYIRLLCYAWMDPNCSLPDDDQQLAALSRLGDRWFKGGSTTLQREPGKVLRACFEASEDLPGRLINKRLIEERQKQDDWREKSREGGRKSAEKRWKSKESEDTAAGKGGYEMVDTKRKPRGNSSSSSSSSSSITTTSSLRSDVDSPAASAKRGAAAENEGPPVMEFATTGTQKTWIMRKSYLNFLTESYPDLDVLAECRKAKAYYDANGLKTAPGMKKALVNWLNRAVQYGANGKGNRGAMRPLEKREFCSNPKVVKEFLDSLPEIKV